MNSRVLGKKNAANCGIAANQVFFPLGNDIPNLQEIFDKFQILMHNKKLNQSTAFCWSGSPQSKFVVKSPITALRNLTFNGMRPTFIQNRYHKIKIRRLLNQTFTYLLKQNVVY